MYLLMKKIFLLSLLVVVLCSGCSKYGYVRLQYPTPPEVLLPESIHTLALANRSLVAEDDMAKAAAESIATGEVAGSDAVASQECLRAVYAGLNGYKNLTVASSTGAQLEGTGMSTIPELLDGKVVQHLCDSDKADALLVLEMFDSNSDLVIGNTINQLDAVIKGQKNPLPETRVNMTIAGLWRLYDANTQKLIDEYRSSSAVSFDVVADAANLPGGTILKQAAYSLGMAFSARFKPGYYYVKRDFFKKGKGSEKEQFLAAFRKSEVSDWKGAADVWQKLTSSSSATNAGRACLNMAVANEVQGDTQKALEWARKSYADYGITLARDYASILQNRLNNE